MTPPCADIEGVTKQTNPGTSPAPSSSPRSGGGTNGTSSGGGSSALSPGSGSSGNSGSGSGSSTSNSTSPSSGGDSKSNTATIVGIAVGVSAGVLVLAGVGLFCFCKRRRQAEAHQDWAAAVAGAAYAKPSGAARLDGVPAKPSVRAGTVGLKSSHWSSLRLSLAARHREMQSTCSCCHFDVGRGARNGPRKPSGPAARSAFPFPRPHLDAAGAGRPRVARRRGRGADGSLRRRCRPAATRLGPWCHNLRRRSEQQAAGWWDLCGVRGHAAGAS